MRRYAFEGGTAVVTGAASGIGAALAAGLAARDSHLVLLDRDADGLAAVAAAVRAVPTGVRVAEHVADLADPAAAVAVGAVIAVNFQAVVTMTRALLPVLTSNPGSHLVALSSIFGILAPPGQTAYCASKFAVRGFLESLRGELAPMGVGVTCVHPGGVRTNIARNAIVGTRLPAAQWELGRDRFDQLLTLAPADAAETILRAVHRRRPRVLVGRDAVIMDKLARLLPVGNGRLLSAVTRRSARR